MTEEWTCNNPNHTAIVLSELIARLDATEAENTRLRGERDRPVLTTWARCSEAAGPVDLLTHSEGCDGDHRQLLVGDPIVLPERS